MVRKTAEFSSHDNAGLSDVLFIDCCVGKARTKISQNAFMYHTIRGRNGWPDTGAGGQLHHTLAGHKLLGRQRWRVGKWRRCMAVHFVTYLC